jgi:flagellin-like hook-associated protein FlgL
MTVAASRVDVKIALKGVDQASGALRSTQKSMGGLSKTSKDLAVAFTGVNQALEVGRKLMAAVGAASEELTRLERMRVQLEHGFGSVDAAFRAAEAIGGVAVESVGRFGAALKRLGIDTMPSIEALKELTARATAAGKSGDEGLNAFSKAIETGSDRALKGIGIYVSSTKALDDYAKAAGKTTTQITDMERASVILNAALKDLERSAGADGAAYAALDKSSANLSNTWEELKLQMS